MATDYQYRTSEELTSAEAVADQIDLAMGALNSASVAIANLNLSDSTYLSGTPQRLLLDAFCDAMKARDQLRATA